MERVLGIGGYFMRAADPVALGAWYRDCLGLDADETACGVRKPGRRCSRRSSLRPTTSGPVSSRR
jgi:hypothetical protein